VNSFRPKFDHSNIPHYQIRRSQRAKKTRIVVTTKGVEVVAPSSVSEHAIKAFVEMQKEWIENSLRRIRERHESIKPFAPIKYDQGTLIPYRGRLIALNIRHTNRKTVSIEWITDDAFVAHVPAKLRENHSDPIRAAMIAYMKQQAKLFALHFVEKHCTKHGLIPRSLRIKTQKSRWGSCGPRNDLNLNWLLVLAPPVIMEYVVIHELCHIKHKNHSKEFWGLVGDHMPEYQEHRNWLKQHGTRLMQGL